MAINHFSPHSHYKTISGCVKIRHGSLSLHRSGMISLFVNYMNLNYDHWPAYSHGPCITIIITDLIIPVMQKYIWDLKAGKSILDETTQFLKRWKVNFMSRSKPISWTWTWMSMSRDNLASILFLGSPYPIFIYGSFIYHFFLHLWNWPM